MAGTITVTVGGGRSRRAAVLFLGANTLVSGAIGLGLVLAGRGVPREVLLFAMAASCLAYVVWFLARGSIPWLPWPPQLSATWLDRERPDATALRYGVVWGLAFATPIRAGSLVALALLIALANDPFWGSVVFAVVGFVRGLSGALAPWDTASDGPKLASRWPFFHRPTVTALDAIAMTVVLASVLQSEVSF